MPLRKPIMAMAAGFLCWIMKKAWFNCCASPQLNVVDSRKADLKYGQTYSLKVISKDKYLEFYLDGMLIMQCVFYAAREGLMGLVVDRGEAVFEDIDACLLKDCPEED